MKDLLDLLSKTKDELLKSEVITIPTLKYLGPEILSDSNSHEAKLFDATSTEILDIKKRTLAVKLNKPYFVQEIQFDLVGPVISNAAFDLVFLGGTHEEPIEITKNLFEAESKKLVTINSNIIGFKITCKKNIGSALKKIHIFGCETIDYQNMHKAIVSGHKKIADEKANAINQVSVVETVITDIQKKQDNFEALKAEVTEKQNAKQQLTIDLQSLTESLEKLSGEQKESIEKNEKLQRENQNLDANTEASKRELDDIKYQQVVNNKELNQILDKKSFYNETAGGRKKESLSKLYINLGIALLLIALIGKGADFVFEFSREAIKNIPTSGSLEYLVGLAIIKAAPALLFIYFIKYAFKTLSGVLSEIHKQVMDTLSIESKLTLGRSISDNIFKKLTDFSDEERRDYTTAVTMSLMRDHLMLNSSESIAHDFDVDEEKINPLVEKIAEVYKQTKKPLLNTVKENLHLDS